MERRERLALLVTLLILFGLPLGILGYQYWVRPSLSPVPVVEIRAAVPEAGGFQPDSIQVNVGEAITLRFTALDVTHGVALGPGLGVDLGHVDPGEVEEITLTFDRPGTYTFYCTTWCSPDHWRMRGTIAVRDPDNPGLLQTPQHDPVIEALLAEGVDIDATRRPAGHDARPQPTMPRPSASRGEEALPTLHVPPELQDEAWRRTHTPSEALSMLAAANPEVREGTLVDVIAYLWVSNMTAERLAVAEALYNQNCAACHGEMGGGDGPAAGLTRTEPVAFADPAYMFSMRDDVLYAKIRRGGMGTSMPNFGTLLTPEETWALVTYLRGFSAGPLDSHTVRPDSIGP